MRHADLLSSVGPSTYNSVLGPRGECFATEIDDDGVDPFFIHFFRKLFISRLRVWMVTMVTMVAVLEGQPGQAFGGVSSATTVSLEDGCQWSQKTNVTTATTG